MTDNEIIKALECCGGRIDDSCENRECPFYYKTEKCSQCKKMLIENAIELINRQKVEIKNNSKKLRGIFSTVAEIKVKAAREIFKEIEKVIGNKYEYYVFDNRDIEGVEQDAIIAFADAMKKHYAKIKKKYTEEN